jgi:hypothetical protein
MPAVRAAGELRPDNAQVAALVLLSGGWLLIIVAWSRCRRRSLPSPHSNRRRGSNRDGTLFWLSLPATSRPQLHAN